MERDWEFLKSLAMREMDEFDSLPPEVRAFLHENADIFSSYEVSWHSLETLQESVVRYRKSSTGHTYSFDHPEA